MAVSNKTGQVNAQTISGTGNQSWNCRGNDDPKLLLTLTGSVSLSFQNLPDGATGKIIVNQNSTGKYSLFFTGYTIVGNTTIKPFPSSVSILEFTRVGTTLYFSSGIEEKTANYQGHDLISASSNFFTFQGFKSGTLPKIKITEAVWSFNLGVGASDVSNNWVCNYGTRLNGANLQYGSFSTSGQATASGIVFKQIPIEPTTHPTADCFYVEFVETGNPGQLNTGGLTLFYLSE